jgi:signal transduction histidine kinase
MSLGRGDTARGLGIACAAFLTIAGAAAPNVSAITMTAILFLGGAALLLFVAAIPGAGLLPPANDRFNAQPEASPASARQPSNTCLQELLTPHKAATSCDRAAFARLTAHMSHELRTPLNAIIGFSELMSNEVFGPLGSSSYAAYARDIHASGMSLLKSAEDALAITSLLTAPDQQHRSAVANAATAATDALAFHASNLAARRIECCCTVDMDAEIVADAQAVRQLLINLIADAVQGAEPGARLSLASRTDGEQVEVLVTIDGLGLARNSSGDSFSMLLARTLSELSSAQLVEDEASACSAGEHHVTARFQRVTQNDFFGMCH